MHIQKVAVRDVVQLCVAVGMSGKWTPLRRIVVWVQRNSVKGGTVVEVTTFWWSDLIRAR